MKIFLDREEKEIANGHAVNLYNAMVADGSIFQSAGIKTNEDGDYCCINPTCTNVPEQPKEAFEVLLGAIPGSNLADIGAESNSNKIVMWLPQGPS
ncbi:MAG: hypothetical protein SGARI_006752 [Bacillariaceae sp.]